MKKRIYFVAVFLFLIQSCAPSIYNVQQNSDGDYLYLDGSLSESHGIPVLTVKGNPYRVGLQYGVLLDPYLETMNYTVDSLVEEFIGSSILKQAIAKIVLKRRIKAIEEKMPERYLQELKGVAEGSILSTFEVKRLAYFPQLFFKISCTSFVLKDEDQMVHGRNLDWSGIDAITAFPLIVNYEIDGYYPFTNLTFVGYPGVYTGMNQEGLSLSINMNSSPPGKGKKVEDYHTGMPLAFKVRSMLEECRTLEETTASLNNYATHAWFITAGSRIDTSGNVYELTRGGMMVTGMEKDFLFVENLSLTEKGRYEYSPARQSNIFNMARIDKVEELHSTITKDDLIEKSYDMLSNFTYYEKSHAPFFAGSVNNRLTVKSCIMDNLNNTIYFSYGPGLAANRQYYQYRQGENALKVFKASNQSKEFITFKDMKKYEQWIDKQLDDSPDDLDYKKVVSSIETTDFPIAYKSYLLATYYDKLRNKDAVFKSLDAYLSAAKNYPEAYVFVANKYTKYKAYAKAVEVLQELLLMERKTPYDDYRAYRELTKSYLRFEDQTKAREEAEKYYQKFLELSGNYFVDEQVEKDREELKKLMGYSND